MEEMMYKALSQVPALAVLAFLVWKHQGTVKMCLDFMTDGDERRNAVLKTLGDDCHDVQRQSIQAMDKTTVALEHNADAYDRVVNFLDRVETKMNSHESK